MFRYIYLKVSSKQSSTLKYEKNEKNALDFYGRHTLCAHSWYALSPLKSHVCIDRVHNN